MHLSALLVSQLVKLVARAGHRYEAVAVCTTTLPLGVDILDFLQHFRVLRVGRLADIFNGLGSSRPV